MRRQPRCRPTVRRQPHTLDSPGGTSRERARRLILATGVADVLPDIPGLDERWGRTVLHCPYCHGFEVADRKLGVLAASELSLHHALLLADWSADVTLFTNDAFAPDAARSPHNAIFAAADGAMAGLAAHRSLVTG